MTVLKEKKMLFMKDFNSGRLPAAKANCAITADIFFCSIHCLGFANILAIGFLVSLRFLQF